MARLVRQAFGLVAMLVGAALVAAGVGQQWWAPRQPFRLGPLIGGLLLGLAFLRYGRKWLFNLITLDVIAVEPGDPAIAEATRRAQDSLPRFWEFLAQNRHECFIKFPMQSERGDVEHIWAVVHSRSNGSVVVSLANEPVDQPRDTSARRVVAVNDIEDWQVIVSETEIRGGYSIAALAQVARSRGDRLSRADQRRLRAFVDVQPV